MHFRHFSAPFGVFSFGGGAAPVPIYLGGAAAPPAPPVPTPLAAAVTSDSRAKSFLCFNCKEVGHIQRNCPKLRQSSGGNKPARSSPPKCYFCDEIGHVKSDCPELKEWRKAKASKAGAVSDVSKSSSGSTGGDRAKCLCTAQRGQPGSLPYIYVDVSGSSDEEDWQRVEAAVDTGSARTLVSLSTVERLHLSVSVEQSTCELVALDGNFLSVLGTVDLKLRRLDGSVSLPVTYIQAVVVSQLDVVETDVLIGSDLVAVAGGLKLEYDSVSGTLSAVRFGCDRGESPSTSTAASLRPEVELARDVHPSQHVTTQYVKDGVVFKTNDGQVKWSSELRRWELSWKWKNDRPPEGTLGSGIGEYSRSKLSPEQEQLFSDEVDSWIANGWLVEHNLDVHGEPAAVLPLLAVCQEHKSSTPVRPCLDYKILNNHLSSKPGADVPVCEEKLRSWRRVDSSQEYELLDIRKAYLQVHVAPELARYQTVIWRGQKYVMTRMGFGLCIAPKFMDIIVQWATRRFPDVDNYVDDLLVPAAKVEAVSLELLKYSLPTKPSEPLDSGRVLGLQLSRESDGRLHWRRRDISSIVDEPATRRAIFSWCGKVISHYPVCSWLRPACSYLKRIASQDCERWDGPVSADTVQCWKELQARLKSEDPVQGVWPVNAGPDTEFTVWCDASNVAIGVVVEVNGDVAEDACWLRPKKDTRHINIAELEAIIMGVSLGAKWSATKMKLMTDSKTVYGWLKSILENEKRVKVSGLNATIVRRRLQTIADLVATGFELSIEWVPSKDNLADKLTRVPQSFRLCEKASRGSTSNVKRKKTRAAAAAVTVSRSSTPTVLCMDEIAKHQAEDADIKKILQCKSAGKTNPVSAFKKIYSQLVVVNGMLMRSIKLPPGDLIEVPVVPSALESKAIEHAHVFTGHGCWETTYRFLRSHCYIVDMANKCQKFVALCSACSAANPVRGPSVAPIRPAVPDGPWSTVQLDTLELGASSSDSEYHCVLVCIDSFTKWVEVIPLVRHDAQSVASAFVNVCARWGPPDLIRCDNGTELYNGVTSALYDAFGVQVKRGAVRHPQSQGAVERFNRTLLNIIRKVLCVADDWKLELDMLLYYYRVRPHAITHISPFQAMSGWQPRGLLVHRDPEEYSVSAWADRLQASAARIRDYLESELSSRDFLDVVSTNPYVVGQPVMLHRSDRRQKRSSPYEPGWIVKTVISASTVVIERVHADGRYSSKVVNIDLLKGDPINQTVEHVSDNEEDAGDVSFADIDDQVLVELDLPEPIHNLRDRTSLQLPARYCG